MSLRDPEKVRTLERAHEISDALNALADDTNLLRMREAALAAKASLDAAIWQAAAEPLLNLEETGEQLAL